MALTRIGLNQSINLASNVTGTLPIANGGTAITSGFVNGNTKGLVHLSTTNISDGDSEVELTFSSSYDNYRLIISDLVPQSTSGTDGRIYLKRSGQSSYDTSSGNYWRTGYDMRSSSTTMNGTGIENGSNAQILGWNIDGDNANASSYNVVEIGGVNNTSAYTMIDCFSTQYPRGDSTDDFASVDYHYFHSQAGKVTNLKLSPGSGNWQSGKVLFYGYGES
jgi:hypothetical protein